MSADDDGPRAPQKAPLAATTQDAAAAPAREDVVFVHGPSEAGEGFRVIRKRDDVIEVGEIRTIQEGKPIHGDIVKLTKRDDSERLFNVEVLVQGPKQGDAASADEGARTGPAQVATAAYRRNWEAIFGPPKGELN